MNTKNQEQAFTRRLFLFRAISGTAAAVVFPILGACGLGLDGRFSQNGRASGVVKTDGGDDEFVTLYDTYAVATYFDGGIGPTTGTITVAMVDANLDVDLEFWHGHSGKTHQYRITARDFQSLRDLKKVWIETTSVDGHAHKLFIDPTDPNWRVPGAQPVRVKKSRP